MNCSHPLSLSGGYSSVVKGNHNQTHVDYAIKLFDKSKLTKADYVRLRREVEINFAISHPNIVKVHEVYESEEDISLVMDLYVFHSSCLLETFHRLAWLFFITVQVTYLDPFAV